MTGVQTCALPIFAILDGFDDDNIFFIDDKGIPFEIKRKNIAMIRLAIVF